MIKTKHLFVSLALTSLSFTSFAQGKDLPSGKSGKEADDLAHKILNAINYEAWKNTRFVQWTFVGKRHFVWDKFEQNVEVKWDDVRVVFSTKNFSGRVYSKGKIIEGEQKTTLLKKAIDAFNNDSFWLNAPAKVFDDGTSRQLIKDPELGTQLLVTYSSGGSTPGDSYLWTVDENGRPIKWEMWVSIIPEGGVPTTWENWTKTKTGAWIALTHNTGSSDVPISNVKTGSTLSEIGLDASCFE